MASEFVPHSHVPYGEDGSGLYSDSVEGCFGVIENATPMVTGAIDSIKFDTSSGKVFVVADYGTADGGTSVPLLTHAIGKLKEKHGPEQEVQINYEDQPMNDFKSLFLRIHGLSGYKSSYLATYKGVFVNACGTGFYDQCFPSNSVNLGFSATAMHWLLERPCNLKSCLHASSSSDASEIACFQKAASESWERNLLHRARELAPGGHMVVANLGTDQNGQFLGTTDRVKEKMFDNMSKHWRDMVEEGIINEDEFLRTTFNNYYRNEEETIKPFKDVNSPVYKAGLRLVNVKSMVLPCPYNLAWTKSPQKGNAEEHAKKFILTTRVWSNSTFVSALDGSRSEDEKSKIVDQLFSRYEKQVASSPQDHAMDYVHVYVHFRKEN